MSVKRAYNTPFCIFVLALDIVSRKWFKYPFTNRECTLCAVVCHKAQDPYWYSKITRHLRRSVYHIVGVSEYLSIQAGVAQWQSS